MPLKQDEIEHIIDYLASPDAPKKNLTAMAYPAALKNAEKWMKAQIKKGKHIKESEKDTEIVLDFEDGFKIVKLELYKSKYPSVELSINHLPLFVFLNTTA